MNKNVIVISTSMREGGNSDIMANEFARGASDAGHQVEVVSLHNKTINFCIGCLACQKNGKCVFNDDADKIVQKMLNADVVVFATPVYFYEMTGQMKTLLDRTNPLFASNYQFKDIYLLMSAADSDKSAMDGTKQGVQGWVDCYSNAKLKGTVFAGGVTGVGDIRGHKAIDESYLMGKSI